MKFFLSSIVSALLIGGASSLHAQVLLIVNESNPSAVTVTSTGAMPSTSTSPGEYTFFDGFDLEGLFASDAGNGEDSGTLAGSTLTTGDSSGVIPFNDVVTDNASDSSAFLDLGFYNASGDPDDGYGPYPESFTTSSPAFNSGGTITLNLAGFDLAGMDGVVDAGYSYSVNGVTPIGTYEVVVPEPGTWALMTGALAVLGFCVRRKRVLGG